ncbi:MAG: hypothetical protein Q8M95_06250, partial [Candidatus Methanoperedens sp.]|nr:hypothetical protein [Candidatus Methanoperedens sp.]
MASIKSRKELFALLQAICEDNREYYSRFGRWVRPQIKVFWLEVNERFMESTLQSSGAQHIDTELFLLQYEDEPYWIDT